MMVGGEPSFSKFDHMVAHLGFFKFFNMHVSSLIYMSYIYTQLKCNIS